MVAFEWLHLDGAILGEFIMGESIMGESIMGGLRMDRAEARRAVRSRRRIGGNRPITGEPIRLKKGPISDEHPLGAAMTSAVEQSAPGSQACTPDPESPMTVRDGIPTIVGDLEYVHRVLHAVNVQTQMVELCGFPGDHEDASRLAATHEIALENRTCGWVTIPLTGNEEEDVADYWGGIDPDSVYVRARPINRSRGPVRIRLDRPRLELLLLAHCLLQKRVQSTFGRTCPAAREAAVADAGAMLAADWPAALDRIAASIFQGSPDQCLRQLGGLLDG